MSLSTRYAKAQYKHPCPKCGSWNIKPQTPIDVDIDITDARKALGQYARAIKGGATPLKGPCYIMCFDCRFTSPAVDCRGRTSEDVNQDPLVFSEMKRLWVQVASIPAETAEKRPQRKNAERVKAIRRHTGSTSESDVLMGTPGNRAETADVGSCATCRDHVSNGGKCSDFPPESLNGCWVVRGSQSD